MESIYLGITQELFDRVNFEIFQLKTESAIHDIDYSSQVNSLRAIIEDYRDDELEFTPAEIVKVRGNALDTDCDVLCHQVNLYKSMGGGIARQIAMCFPEVEREYRHFGKAELGEVCFAKAKKSTFCYKLYN